ncbi:DUF2306 domain-containing protein [Halopseudomonas salegens]|uniref:Predicted membrane protein n=1 Tax=Halopseudomonas salegens TaxID=1434072 RepID=A0A1H2F918_9GAMM|nr:DUF2306 domain-containing protein [Halopseudomonas salegens]SDU03834.1 Predicted membrane protein [Halopseudomonas salegens]
MTLLVLSLHITAGFVALAMAGLALASPKGKTWHRRSGSLYVAAMFTVSLSTLWLVVVRPNPFLLAVGVFSFFLVFTGWRAARIRDGRPRWIDHLVGSLMAGAGLTMLITAVVGFIHNGGAQPWILLVFGSIGLSLALSDWRDWRQGPIVGKQRIARHLGRMLAGTIATLTAALVVNATWLPDLVTWLAPTVLITPVIVWWNARVLNGGTEQQAKKA